MLKPEFLDALPGEMVQLYSQVEDDILKDMARRISTYDYYIPSAEHQRQKLREMGMMQSEITKAMSSRTGKSEALLKDMTRKAVYDSLTYDQKIYMAAGLVDKGGPVISASVQRIVNAGYRQTAGVFKNITRTTANTATKQFENALDRAWLQIQTGAFDYNTAIRNTVKQLAAQGIQSIRYPSGHVDTIEVATRRAVLTGVNQTALKAQMAKADEMGCDLVEVSAHAGARPTHAVWQGGIYSRSGESTKYPDFVESTGYGDGDGLGGWNCRHSFRPYIDGQPRTYSPDLLKSYEDKNVSYNGKKYTEYEASQIQRSMERNIRKWKRESVAMRAAGYDAYLSDGMVKKWQVKLNSFLAQTGFKRQNAREQIYTQSTSKSLPKKRKSGTIKAKKTPAAVVRSSASGRPEKSLKNFDAYEQKYLAGHYKGISDSQKEFLRQTLQTAFDQSEYHMAFKSQFLDSLLQTGRFMNQFETNTSGGALAHGARRNATKVLFGSPVSTMKAAEFEKYGYLGLKDFAQDLKEARALMGNWYGDFVVRFKRSAVKDRVTYTLGDSLGIAQTGAGIAGSDGDNVSIAGVQERKSRKLLSSLMAANSTDATNPHKLAAMVSESYLEIQFHGEVTLADVEAICFGPNSVYTQDQVDKLKAIGIQVFVAKGGKTHAI